jgi:hypothetical protein
MAALFIPVEQRKSGSCCAMFVVWLTETPILFSDWQSMRVDCLPAAASNGAATGLGVDQKDEGELGRCASRHDAVSRGAEPQFAWVD